MSFGEIRAERTLGSRNCRHSYLAKTPWAFFWRPYGHGLSAPEEQQDFFCLRDFSGFVQRSERAHPGHPDVFPLAIFTNFTIIQMRAARTSTPVTMYCIRRLLSIYLLFWLSGFLAAGLAVFCGPCCASMRILELSRSTVSESSFTMVFSWSRKVFAS